MVYVWIWNEKKMTNYWDFDRTNKKNIKSCYVQYARTDYFPLEEANLLCIEKSRATINVKREQMMMFLVVVCIQSGAFCWRTALNACPSHSIRLIRKFVTHKYKLMHVETNSQPKAQTKYSTIEYSYFTCTVYLYRKMCTHTASDHFGLDSISVGEIHLQLRIKSNASALQYNTDPTNRMKIV